MILLLFVTFTLNMYCSTHELETDLTPFNKIIVEGNLNKLIEELVTVHTEPIYYLAKIDINAKDARGRTALFIAAQCGHATIIAQLLQIKNLEIDKQNKDNISPLAIALNNGHLDAVKVLKKHLASPVSRGKSEIIKMLVLHGSTISQESKEKQETTLLHKATSTGDKKKVKWLINNKANVNIQEKDGTTPLHWAVIHGHIDIIKLLLNHKANVNAKDHSSATPLHEAARIGHKEIVKLLIKNNANINAQDHTNWTPLDWAEFYKHTTTAELLKK